MGVVHLRSAKGRELRKNDPIIWTELCSHGKANQEFRNREAGQVCLNITSITSSFDPGHFSVGDSVALVDCMTFVPEYIPVLRALQQQALEVNELPFDQGSLLNLCQSKPADLSNMLDVSSLSGPSSEAVGQSTVYELVSQMVESSSLLPIREIRNSHLPSLTQQLTSSLAKLIEETTLDNGQLINFIDALRNPVHLTQGPPGTGKSYLGVVLVRALETIRDLWKKAVDTL